MFQLRKALERGHFNHGWLDTYHTFSFSEYHDPAYMGFRVLRVMNEDRIAPGQGFGTHGHRDMEIVTYVLEGALEHKDSMGNGSVLRPGEFQHMSAGTGIRHSEFNPSDTEPVHLYQIWLLPRQGGLPPTYDQKHFPEEQKQGRWRLVASPDGADGSITIQQDTKIFLSNLSVNQTANHVLPPGRYAWLQLLRGRATSGGIDMTPGDGLAVSDELELIVTAEEPSELMLFELP
jgi:redox-sensitive bicupin YhaK (pirin superfamily)